jgi:hypothetical protein
MEAMPRARAARMLVRNHRSGMLSSHSLKFPGYPYGSALPHVTDHAGRPVVLISHLAEHTQNLEMDARASFIVCDSGADLQAKPRVTVLGAAHAVGEAAPIERRYLRFYPDHAQYLQIGGFRFYALEPFQVRCIQGFGGLHWIAGKSYLAPDAMRDAEEGILAHMNQDHGDALRAYCRHVHGVEPETAEMVGFDCDGFDLRVDGRLLRFDFAEPVLDPGQARSALVELAQKSRNG